MLDKFEEKINQIKGKINKKVLAVAIFCLFGAVIITTSELIKNLKLQKQQIQDEYNKAMYEAVSYINNLEMELAKIQLISTQNLKITTLSSIWKHSSLAKENFDDLPTNQGALQDTSKFLSQVSDYSYSLLKKSINSEEFTDKEKEKIMDIYDRCKKLNKIMIDIYDDLNKGRIKWDKLKKETDRKFDSTKIAEETSNFEGIHKTFQDYEGLIYDGAFSEHLLNITPKSLSKNLVSKQNAKEYIQQIFGKEEVEYINDKGNSSGKIELYNFEVKLKKEEMIRNISITKNDCKLYLMISDRKVENENITMEEAKKKAKEFLEKIGVNNLEDTYYLKNENMAIINYATVEDEIIFYPDLIKVKVALDTGEVCSVESQGYIFNNTKRENIVPKISKDEARKVLNKNINVNSQRLAVIPTDSKDEILTYEFKGSLDEKEFLIYINAMTGLEEKVLMIINTPGGTLTM